MTKPPSKPPARKQTSDSLSTIGSRAMRTGKATPAEIRRMGASLVGQDENKGKRGK